LLKPSPALNNRTPTLCLSRMNPTCDSSRLMGLSLRHSQGRGRRPSLVSSLPRASFDVSIRYGVIALHRLVALATASLELSFPFSARWSRRVARACHDSSCSASTFCRPCGFSLSECQSPPPQVSAAWPRDLMVSARSTFTARCGSCIAAFISAMFRYPLSGTRDLVEFE